MRAQLASHQKRQHAFIVHVFDNETSFVSYSSLHCGRTSALLIVSQRQSETMQDLTIEQDNPPGEQSAYHGL
jgi:hypothetical protein